VVSVEDELFRQFAPAGGRWLMRALVRQNRKTRRLLRWWVRHLQNRAERHYRKQRTETIRRDFEWARALGFVGKTRK
jgi:preprotein translocase subunit SecA